MIPLYDIDFYERNQKLATPDAPLRAKAVLAAGRERTIIRVMQGDMCIADALCDAVPPYAFDEEKQMLLDLTEAYYSGAT